MTEAAAIRYLISKGWQMVEDGWFSLRNLQEQPVCVETAYHLQKMMENTAIAA
jgi:hypothetical protein